jgi:hypothetical protein
VAPDLLTRDELMGTSREECQQVGGLRCQPDSLSAFAQVPCRVSSSNGPKETTSGIWHSLGEVTAL